MKAVLLNPPGRKRRSRRNASATLEAYGKHLEAMRGGGPIAKPEGKAKRKARRKVRKPLGPRPKVGTGCRVRVARYSAWKKRHTRIQAAKKSAAKRKAAKSAKSSSIADVWNSAVGNLASNPRRGKRRNDGGSTWIPAFGGKEDSNPRRKRNATFNYGTAYSRKRNDGGSQWLPAYKNPYWVPRYAQNPGSIVGTVTRGFQPKVLVSTLPYVGGALGNAFLSTFIKKFMPDMLKSGIGGSAVDIASAGLLGASVGMITPGYAGPVFFGGVIDTVLSLANQYIRPLMRSLPGMKGCCGLDGEASMAELSDYMTPQNAQQALPLGDYATTADVAAARPLGDYDEMDSVESVEELA